LTTAGINFVKPTHVKIKSIPIFEGSCVYSRRELRKGALICGGSFLDPQIWVRREVGHFRAFPTYPENTVELLGSDSIAVN